MLYFVVYVSSAIELMSEEELAGVLATSRRNNQKRGVTGALLYQDGNIIQVLEGERTAVRDLFTQIGADPRHRQVIEVTDGEVTDGEVAERDFPDWSMAFGDLSQDTTPLGHQVRALLDSPSDDPGAHLARSLLRSFRETMNIRTGGPRI